MEFGLVLDRLARDLSAVVDHFGVLGWASITLAFVLPIASLMVPRRGARLALIPLVGSLGLLAGWVLYSVIGRPRAWRVTNDQRAITKAADRDVDVIFETGDASEPPMPQCAADVVLVRHLHRQAVRMADR